METVHWDPTREDRLFFLQSAALHCSYYQMQILIHRPFIISSQNPSPLSFSSFALCMNAARSCIHVVDVAHRRAGFLPVTFFQVCVANCFLLLALIQLALSSTPHSQQPWSSYSIFSGQKGWGSLLILRKRWRTYKKPCVCSRLMKIGTSICSRRVSATDNIVSYQMVCIGQGTVSQ